MINIKAGAQLPFVPGLCACCFSVIFFTALASIQSHRCHIQIYTNKIDFCPDSGTASICIYHLSASVRYRHRPIAAAKRGEKTVIFDFCVRFDIDSKGRNVGFGVNLPFYLKLKAVYHLSGKLRTALKLKCCLKAISLVRAQLILSRYRI